jgi:hypothetical protein
MKAELRTYILADAAVSAIIGTRLYPEVAHQLDGSSAYAIYKTLNSTTLDTHVDDGLLYEDLIDLSIHAPTVTEMYDLSDALRAILSNKRITLAPYNLHILWKGINTGYTDNDEVASASITLDITWS